MNGEVFKGGKGREFGNEFHELDELFWGGGVATVEGD